MTSVSKHSVWSAVLTPQHDASVNNLTILEFKSEERFSGSLAQYTFLFNSCFRQARPFLEMFLDMKSKFSVNLH